MEHFGTNDEELVKDPCNELWDDFY